MSQILTRRQQHTGVLVATAECDLSFDDPQRQIIGPVVITIAALAVVTRYLKIFSESTVIFKPGVAEHWCAC